MFSYQSRPQGDICPTYSFNEPFLPLVTLTLTLLASVAIFMSSGRVGIPLRIGNLAVMLKARLAVLGVGRAVGAVGVITGTDLFRVRIYTWLAIVRYKLNGLAILGRRNGAKLPCYLTDNFCLGILARTRTGGLH